MQLRNGDTIFQKKLRDFSNINMYDCIVPQSECETSKYYVTGRETQRETTKKNDEKVKDNTNL